MPGWSVVLKKESRSRRINSTEQDHSLGQEGSADDLQVLANMESPRMTLAEDIGREGTPIHERNGRRRNGN